LEPPTQTEETFYTKRKAIIACYTPGMLKWGVACFTLNMVASDISERFVTPVKLCSINIFLVYSSAQINCGISLIPIETVNSKHT
jgi:hypothetical protein